MGSLPLDWSLVDLLPLVLVLPLLGVVVLALFGRWLSDRAAAWFATVMVGLAFLLAVVIGADFVRQSAAGDEAGGAHREVVPLWPWFAAGENLVEVTMAITDVPSMAPIPADAVGRWPARADQPQMRAALTDILPQMWDPEAVVGQVNLGAPLVVGTPLTLETVPAGPDGFVLATPATGHRFSVAFALLLDGLSLVMLLVVTGVGFLIHVFSIGYMAGDDGVRRFFIYMNLFVFSMLTLVLAANFLVLFVGWELVGLCSYLLIGFWFAQRANADAGRKAFIVNRVGDFAFLLGLMLIWTVFGSLSYAQVLPAADKVLALNSPIAIAIALLLLIGATGKSAQLPLFVWLPDAMAGPTPVSALIHAATMVTAGVYMIARAHTLFEQAPSVMALVAIVGAATALFAALVAVVQVDIKRMLAFSTISQLGFMFLAVGVGAYVAGIFHLMTHAFFKALLFLGAGSLMHAMEHGFHHAGAHPDAENGIPAEQDMRRMGGLLSRARITGWTFVIGALALAGVFPLAGFWSKDEILLDTLAHAEGRVDLWVVLYGVALFTAFLTALYAGRGALLALTGPPRSEGAERAVESPPLMTVPLVVLALLTVLGGLPGIALFGTPWMVELLEPVFGGAHGGASLSKVTMALVASAVALLGLAVAWAGYAPRRWFDPSRLAVRASRLHKLVWNAFYVDALYMLLFVRPFRAASGFLWRVIDDDLVDGAVNGIGRATLALGQWSRRWQTGYVRTYVLSMLLGAVAIALYFFLMVR